MARTSQLISILSAAAGIPERSVDNYARSLRKEGLFPKGRGGRGGAGAAAVSREDIASLLIALCAPVAADGPGLVRLAREMTFYGARRNFISTDAGSLIPLGHEDQAALVEDNFFSAVAALLEPEHPAGPFIGGIRCWTGSVAAGEILGTGYVGSTGAIECTTVLFRPPDEVFWTEIGQGFARTRRVEQVSLHHPVFWAARYAAAFDGADDELSERVNALKQEVGPRAMAEAAMLERLGAGHVGSPQRLQ